MAASAWTVKEDLDLTLDNLTHYAIIYIDHDGNLKTSASRSIQQQCENVFNMEARQNFLEIIRQPTLQIGQQRFSSDGSSTLGIRIGDTESVISYYTRILNCILYRSCSSVLKVLITVIEPQKSLHHPYNGGEKGDPEMTKPDWWPSRISHTYPNHLKKQDCIDLFLHILRKAGLTADGLVKIATDARLKLKRMRDLNLILELLWVRNVEEQFERCVVHADDIIYVTSCSVHSTFTESTYEALGRYGERTDSSSNSLNQRPQWYHPWVGYLSPF
ncbi:Protein of unknown function DUF2841 [Penicillium griseofulvum]|uniref:Subtelomeric hrmA-associated cluster protein AFUB-079030/YDR124W-like helical bundle domain-containing protein n=1 Tax=Penicillium patulum TaxID=5078 RepID=A0A135LQP7_PENPA|nr:Protein of unknown function DUF2841 [Penicillium griseofulvum]KXG51295.1 Protein of unknown function DUF2841 [Penicillium griseofulvum]